LLVLSDRHQNVEQRAHVFAVGCLLAGSLGFGLDGAHGTVEHGGLLGLVFDRLSLGLLGFVDERHERVALAHGRRERGDRLGRRREILRAALRVVEGIDAPLLMIVLTLAMLGMAALFSASYDNPGRVASQTGNLVLALTAMWMVAQVPPQTMMRFALPAFAVGLALLVAVALFGDVVNGARRWLHVGVTRFQPSEVMKLALPMMLAWYFHKNESTLRLRDFAVAAVILAVPLGLILRQPDLGTAGLVGTAGFFVIFFAGVSWKLLGAIVAAGAAALPLLWGFMHDYQRRRVLTLLDPTQDPLGAGYHIIQSTIAVGSGGLSGKGWLNGTQAHLEFIPERHTDFIFAVFSEEFGLIGNLVLLVLYSLLVARGLVIARDAATLFGRLLAGSIALQFFVYAFVNMGMVSGILPVVGVPLPFLSYGGTALLTLFIGVGMLMSIQRHRTLVQT
jgi:rod shape determining protein RodA